MSSELSEVKKVERSECHEFGTGSVRSKDVDGKRYSLIDPEFFTRAAKAAAEGEEKYGRDNWLKGQEASRVFDHLIDHLLKWQLGDRSEDHLGHASWNIMALMHFERERPDMMDLPNFSGDYWIEKIQGEGG